MTKTVVEVAPAVAEADQSAFTELFARHRRELQAHAYRILGSHEDAEDVMQETFLRSWARRDTFEGGSSVRSWLYRIATNTSLTALARGPARRAAHVAPPDQVRLLEAIAASDAPPDDAVASNETVELALRVALQHMSPRQRAVLFLRDVLGWSARDTAELLNSTVVSANSALQRARATLRAHLGAPRTEWGTRG